LRTHFNRVFRYVDADKLLRALLRLGVEKGSTVCVHSALSSLGYIKGGPACVIEALTRSMGETGTVVMPVFTMPGGTMQRQLESNKIFDVRTTPSTVGAITEAFRKADGVMRSIHPTHSVAARGAQAATLVHGHEHSRTPLGASSPYGRLSDMEDSYMLMLGTRLLSLPHHLQERVEFPNLFLDEEREVECIGWNGESVRVRTKVMQPKIPYFVAIPPSHGEEPDWCILHDFCLNFPRQRERDIRAAGYHAQGYDPLWRRRQQLEEAGIFRSTRLGAAELGLLNIKQFLALIEPELRTLIERYRGYYDREKIAALGLSLV
jgi:aminoglycoside N3'-acetyltransferase